MAKHQLPPLISSLALLFGALCTILGAGVLFGWYTGDTTLIQINPAFAPMQFNTALAFVLAGVGLMALTFTTRRAPAIAGALVTAIGVLTLSQYLLQLDLGIDELFMTAYIEVETSHPGRMAPNSALCFTLYGLALLFARQYRPRPQAWAGCLGATVFALAAVAFGGYFSRLETAYGWGELTRMAVHTSVCFTLLGIGLLLHTINLHRTDNNRLWPQWFPWAIVIAGLTLTLAAWQALVAYERNLVKTLGENVHSLADESLLTFGLLATLCLALVIKRRMSGDKVGAGFVPLSAGVLGLALAISLHQFLEGSFRAQTKIRFDAAVKEHAYSIEQGMQPYIEALFHIRTAFRASTEINREEFNRFTARDLSHLPGILSLQWAPAVPAEERRRFEQQLGEETEREVVIRELNRGGGLAVAAQRPWYFPVKFLEPFEFNQKALGFDIGSNPPGIQRLWTSVDRDSLAISDRVDLIQTDDTGYGIIVALPVYHNDMPISDAISRRNALQGFAVAVLDVGPMIETILERSTKAAGIHLQLDDLGSGTPEFLYHHRSRETTEAEADPALVLSTPIQVGHRQWQLTATAANADNFPPRNPGTLILPSFLFFLSLVLANFLYHSSRRQEERGRLIKELAARERHFSALVNTIPGVAYTSRLTPGWPMIFASREIESLTGYHASDFLRANGRIFGSLIHPDDRERVRKVMTEGIATNAPYSAEYRIITRTLEERWVFERGQALYDESGHALEIHGTIFDITARKQEEAKVIGLVEAAPDSMVIINEQGKITLINKQTESLLGYQRDELLDQPMEVLLPERFKAAHPRVRAGYFKKPQVRQMGVGLELTARHKSGKEIPVEISLSPLNTQEGLLVSAAIRDITQRKALERELTQAKEKAEEATRAKSDFLANMSHEIRTPMNSIIGMSHLALQTGLDKQQRNYVEKVHRSAESLLGIINDILDFSKIEAGKLELDRIPFQLEEVFANLANLVGLKAEEKGIELLFDVPPDVPTRLLGDPLRLGQVLVNLGNNAIKFTHQGEVVIRVAEARRDDDNIELAFEVRDTGIGMNEDQVGKLFRSFTQADTSITRKYGGTGLGLTICKSLTALMGGEIQVSSTEGEGSSFRFTAHFGLDQRQVPSPPRGALPPGQLKVLVVDDNTTAREILKALLTSFEFEVHDCANGQCAIDLVIEAETAPFDLVVMDWKMPDLDGVETLRRMQARSSQAPKAIMVTAYGREDAQNAARGVEIQGFLTKPVTPSSLLDAIVLALGKAPSLQDQDPNLAPEAWQLAGHRILLVEDNELNQELATELLSQQGMEVVVANNGQEALDLLDEQRFDLVLMDCQMPVMDGYTATQRIRENPLFANLPIVALTANAMAGDREKALGAGMNDHIAKPISPELLFQSLHQWLTRNGETHDTP